MKPSNVLITILIIIIAVIPGCEKTFDQQAELANDDGINALILVPKNFGLNYQLMREVIDQYGWNITHTGVWDTITPCPPVKQVIDISPIIPDLKIS